MSAELRLRTAILDAAAEQGFWTSNTNDRFVSGKPDMRMARIDVGQMDFELKILGCSHSTIESGRSVLSGVTKLQEIELRDMNLAGARAVGLILLPDVGRFVFCNYKNIVPKEALQISVPWDSKAKYVDVRQIFLMATTYLAEKIL